MKSVLFLLYAKFYEIGVFFGMLIRFFTPTGFFALIFPEN